MSHFQRDFSFRDSAMTKSLFSVLRYLSILVIISAVLIILCCHDRRTESIDDGQVLNGILTSKIRTLDAADITDTTSLLAASQIFESLYQYHYLKRPYELVCQLAESEPEISEDGLVYKIRIKQGVFFADDECFAGGKGRELKAEDFVYAWKRMADIKNLCGNWWIFAGKIAGLDDFREYSRSCRKAEEVDYDREIEGLKAPDDYTLQIKLTRPWRQIKYFLARAATAPVAREAVKYYGREIISHPVGTGPYKLNKWHRGSFIELVENENFRDEYYPSEGQEGDDAAGLLDDAGRKLPLTKRLVLKVIEEDQPRWFLFMQGKVDLCIIPQENFGMVLDDNENIKEELARKGICLKIFDDPSTFWLGFNMADELVGGNRALRQAISCAVDKDRFNDVFYNGRALTARGFIPPMLKSVKPDSKEVYQTDYDPDRARQLVKRAEEIYGGKLPVLVLSVPGTGSGYRQQGDFFRHFLSDVGLEVEIEYMDWPRFQDKMRKGQLQMFLGGWIGQYPDAENFLGVFFSGNISSGVNSFNYKSEEYDGIYEQVLEAEDDEKREGLYMEAERIVRRDVPAVFLRHGQAFILHHGWLCNYKPHSFGYGLSKYRRVDNSKKSAYGR